MLGCSPSKTNAKFAVLDGEPSPARRRSLSFGRRSSPSTSSTSPLWSEAYAYVDRLQANERYADRQRTAHKLAKSLAGLHASAPDDALELLRHIDAIGSQMNAPLVASLLDLVADAQEAQPPDAFTVQLVLTCLTNMSVGSGIKAILSEGDAIQVLVSCLVANAERTRDFTLACVYNLASTTERRLQPLRALLLDALISGGVRSTLRRAVRLGTEQNAEFAQTTLNYMLSRRNELSRTRSNSSSTRTAAASPLAGPALHRSASFDRATSGEHVSADSMLVEADGDIADSMGSLSLGSRLSRRTNGGYNLVMAVITPEWASDVACVDDDDDDEVVVTAVATVATPRSSPARPVASATFASDRASPVTPVRTPSVSSAPVTPTQAGSCGGLAVSAASLERRRQRRAVAAQAQAAAAAADPAPSPANDEPSGATAPFPGSTTPPRERRRRRVVQTQAYEQAAAVDPAPFAVDNEPTSGSTTPPRERRRRRAAQAQAYERVAAADPADADDEPPKAGRNSLPSGSTTPPRERRRRMRAEAAALAEANAAEGGEDTPLLSRSAAPAAADSRAAAGPPVFAPPPLPVRASSNLLAASSSSVEPPHAQSLCFSVSPSAATSFLASTMPLPVAVRSFGMYNTVNTSEPFD